MINFVKNIFKNINNFFSLIIDSAISSAKKIVKYVNNFFSLIIDSAISSAKKIIEYVSDFFSLMKIYIKTSKVVIAYIMNVYNFNIFGRLTATTKRSALFVVWLFGQAGPLLTYYTTYYIPQYTNWDPGFFFFNTFFSTPERFFCFNLGYQVFWNWLFYSFDMSWFTAPPGQSSADVAVATAAAMGKEAIPVVSTNYRPSPSDMHAIAIWYYNKLGTTDGLWSWLDNTLSMDNINNLSSSNLKKLIDNVNHIKSTADCIPFLSDSGEVVNKPLLNSIPLNDLHCRNVEIRLTDAVNYEPERLTRSDIVTVNFAQTGNPHYPLFPLEPSKVGPDPLDKIYLGHHLGDKFNFKEGKFVILFLYNDFNHMPHSFDLSLLHKHGTSALSLMRAFEYPRVDTWYYNHGYLGIIEYYPITNRALFDYTTIDSSFDYLFGQDGEEKVSPTCVEQYRVETEISTEILRENALGEYTENTVGSAYKNSITNTLGMVMDYYNDATAERLTYSQPDSRISMNELADMLRAGTVSLYIPKNTPPWIQHLEIITPPGPHYFFPDAVGTSSGITYGTSIYTSSSSSSSSSGGLSLPY